MTDGEATLVRGPAGGHGGRTFLLDAMKVAERNATSMLITVCPAYSGVTSAIGELQARNAECVGVDDILAIDLSAPTTDVDVEPGIEVVEVSTRAEVAEFELTTAHAWGYPEPTSDVIEDACARLSPGSFLAYRGCRAAGSAGFTLVGQVARLWGGAVVPELRGCGVYRALVASRLSAASARGATLALVHAATSSSPILQRIGFQKFGERRTFRVTL
ncbi:MAG: GNAT family N-acetyltransferase [Mycobacterium sp.]|nr:GNAT family N-acetyltransferase [Mycobacterium sp.]